MKPNRYVLLLLVVAVVLFFGQGAWVSASPKDQPLTSQTFIDVSKQLLPSVISIKVKRDSGASRFILKKRGEGEEKEFEAPPQDFMDELRKRFGFEFPFHWYEMPEFEIEPVVSGSGLIISSDGYILTNAHVIDGAKDKGIEIALNDERTFSNDKVKIIGVDRLTDIAVLKIDAKDLQPAKWGDSDNAQIGEWVLALGNPFELRGSVTQGIISAKHRVIGKAAIEDLFQTTAIINPGNSGGPLVNLDGEVVGINVAIASTLVQAWQGIGFAIPSNTVKKVSESLIKQGKVSRGYIGIRMKDIDDRIASYYDLKDREGVMVASVESGSPADKAGIKRYDIIKEVNAAKVKNPRDMLNEIATKSAGDKVTVKFMREEEGKLKEQTVTAVLAERPPESELMVGPETETLKEGFDALGLSLEEVAGKEDKPEAVKVKEVKPGSPADKAGLRTGDKIVEVNREPVKSIKDFNEALKKVRPDKAHLVTLERDSVIQITTISPPKSTK